MRLLQNRAARLRRDHRIEQRVHRRGVREAAGALAALQQGPSGAQQKFARRHFIHHAQLARMLRARRFSAENDVERLGTPMRRGSRVQPPHAGRMPSFVSGRPSFVQESGDAARQSHARQISYPPPTAAPCTAAAVGYGRAAMRLKTACPSAMNAFISSPVIFCTAWRSAPATKIASFALVRIRPFG